MNRIKRYLIIIGANARITRFLLKDLASEQIFEEIYLISSSKVSKAITANNKRTHLKFTNGNLNRVIKSLIIEKGGMYSFLFCNIPSREIFEVLEVHNYLHQYEKFYQLVNKKIWFDQVIFLGTTAAVHPNVFGSQYNKYRIRELKNFYSLWLNSGLYACLCIVPPLETSVNPIAKLFFVEKREIWSKKVIKILKKEKRIHFEYPYRFHTRLIVKILTYLNLNKLY